MDQVKAMVREWLAARTRREERESLVRDLTDRARRDERRWMTEQKRQHREAMHRG